MEKFTTEWYLAVICEHWVLGRLELIDGYTQERTDKLISSFLNIWLKAKGDFSKLEEELKIAASKIPKNELTKTSSVIDAILKASKKKFN